jgi:hypothetical protein
VSAHDPQLLDVAVTPDYGAEAHRSPHSCTRQMLRLAALDQLARIETTRATRRQ